jgi:hypothetical protein
MKGLYLNDIPISLFMEYFNKTNLARRDFKTKYADDPIIYTYEFTADASTYFYKSPFAFNNILGDIQNYYGVTSITTPEINSTSAIDKLYYNPVLQTIIPYKYRMKDLVGSTWEHFIEFDETTVTDLKDNTLIYPTATIEYNDIYKRWDVYTPSLVAYIYENKEFKIPYFDSTLGKYIYIDEYQRETTENGIDYNFGRYNSTIRSVLNNVQDITEIIPQRFLPECIGLVNQGYNKKLVYYEKYKRTTTYSIGAPGTPDLKEYINRETVFELNDTAADIVLEEYTYPMTTVLDFTTVPEIRTEETSTAGVYKKLESYPLYGIGKPVIIKVYKNFVNFANKDREFKNNSIIWLPNQSVYAELSGTDKIKIALTSNKMFRYYNDKNSISYATIRGTTNKYMYIGSVRYPVDSTVEPNFPYGSFLYPYDRTDILAGSFFGSITAETETQITLGKYDTSFLASREPLNTASTQTMLIQDMYDTSLFIQKTEVYEKVTSTSVHTITEFLDYFHNTAGTQITLNSGKTMSRAANITSFMTLDSFIGNFDRFEHYITEGFSPNNITAFRGDLVPEGIFKQRKLDAIRTMMSTFMEKRYDNFLFDNAYNIFEDDMLMKMRVFAEGYKKLVNSDRNLINLDLAKKPRILSTDLSKSILISKDEKASNYLKKIGENEGTIYLRKEFEPNPTYISNKLNQENVFTRLIEYDKFPTDTLRKKYLREQSSRLQAYSDFVKSTRVLDDNRVLERVYKINIPSLLDYKNFVIYNLIENFYAYNTYTGDDKYLKNYDVYLKDKILDESDYVLATTEQPEKLMYLKDSLVEEDLLEKILIEDWKVL